ncbi:hypothetical protein, partial [Escherichia coli]|uniref:hypothetical protein n=1 Tax=Escherichia coli TaxID=562 RepID=UPI002964CAF9
MGSCAAPSAKGDDKFITTDYLQQCRLSPLDYSVGIGTGLELGHFQFMFGYDYPLSNSSKDPDLSQVRQHNFRASIAYSFRKLKK